MVDQGFREKIYVTDYNVSEEVEKQFISIRAEILDYNSFHPEDTTYENRNINKTILAAPMNQVNQDKRFKEKLIRRCLQKMTLFLRKNFFFPNLRYRVKITIFSIYTTVYLNKFVFNFWKKMSNVVINKF